MLAQVFIPNPPHCRFISIQKGAVIHTEALGNLYYPPTFQKKYVNNNACFREVNYIMPIVHSGNAANLKGEKT
jgi:hypothetical protein